MVNREPGKRDPQVILHDIVLPELSRCMNKGNEGQQMSRLDYISDPPGRCNYVVITTDAGDRVRLIIDPSDPKGEKL